MEQQKPMANENVTTECHTQNNCVNCRQYMNGERKLEGSEKHTELTY